MRAVPVQAAIEVGIEKPCFFGQDRQQRAFPKDLVQPTRACSRRTNNKKRGEKRVSVVRRWTLT